MDSIHYVKIIKIVIQKISKKISVEGVVLHDKLLTNFEILSVVNKLGIPNFRGVFLRDVWQNKSLKRECGTLNLGDSSGNGSHWMVWFKNADKKYYFDSFGVQPPLQLIDYLKPPVYYNMEEIQTRNEVFCGHLCLYILKHPTFWWNFARWHIITL